MQGPLPAMAITGSQLRAPGMAYFPSVYGKITIAKMDNAAVISTQILGVNWYVFKGQVFADKFAVDFTDAVKISAIIFIDDCCSTENFCPQQPAIGAFGHHVINEKVHGVTSIASRFGGNGGHAPGVARITEQEVIHANNSVLRIIEAGGNT